MLVVINGIFNYKQNPRPSLAISPWRDYFLRNIPNLTTAERRDQIASKASFPVQYALKAAISATGDFPKVLSPVNELYTQLRAQLGNGLPNKDLDTIIPISEYNQERIPVKASRKSLAKAVQDVNDDTTKLRKLAMRIRHNTAKQSKQTEQTKQTKQTEQNQGKPAAPPLP